MKIKILGNNDNIMSGVPQIIQGFKELGHEIVTDNPDMIYHPTGFFEELIDEGERYPEAITVGCLLDANPTNPYWPAEKVKDQLKSIDHAVTISHTARKQILARTGEDTSVVYYPIKPVTQEKYEARGLDFICVGRIYSENKRFYLVEEFLKAVSYNKDYLVTAGPEQSPFGYYAGVMRNETLNILYNSAKYLLFFSSHEGLGLSPIEAICAGCIPILCNDNECVEEFGLELFAANPDPVSLAAKLKSIEENRQEYIACMDALRPVFLEQFNGKKVAENILNVVLSK